MDSQIQKQHVKQKNKIKTYLSIYANFGLLTALYILHLFKQLLSGVNF